MYHQINLRVFRRSALLVLDQDAWHFEAALAASIGLDCYRLNLLGFTKRVHSLSFVPKLTSDRLESYTLVMCNPRFQVHLPVGKRRPLHTQQRNTVPAPYQPRSKLNAGGLQAVRCWRLPLEGKTESSCSPKALHSVHLSTPSYAHCSRIIVDCVLQRKDRAISHFSTSRLRHLPLCFVLFLRQDTKLVP